MRQQFLGRHTVLNHASLGGGEEVVGLPVAVTHTLTTCPGLSLAGIHSVSFWVRQCIAFMIFGMMF